MKLLERANAGGGDTRPAPAHGYGFQYFSAAFSSLSSRV